MNYLFSHRDIISKIPKTILRLSFLFFSVFFLLISFSCRQQDTNEIWLKKLDESIENRAEVIQSTEAKIAELKKVANTKKDKKEKYIANRDIIEAYLWFRSDSANAYVQKNLAIANELDNRFYKDESMLLYSMILSTGGLLNESWNVLQKVKRQTLDPELQRLYYQVNERFYYVSSEVSHDHYYAPLYKKNETAFIDSARSTYPLNSVEYNKYTGNLLVNAGKYEEARDLLLKTIPEMEEKSRFAAMVYYDLAEIYLKLGEKSPYEYYLIRASIVDQKVPLKENAAIKELAFYLYQNSPNQISRANNYIQAAMQDARFYNNRQRILQISEKLPIIVSAFQEKSKTENQNLKIYITVISLLAFGVFFSLFFIYRQNRLLKKAKYKLKNINAELNLTNAELNLANTELHKSKEIREEHIGLFMNMSSSYVNRLDDYRNLVKRKIIANQGNDLLKSMDSPQTSKLNTDDFLVNFDKAILSLFPNFIQKVNELLKDGEQLVPEKGNLLNTELRILALLRLGVNNSTKIAFFLHYSSQTIYNYRVRLRNKAIGDRDSFEQCILEIDK